MTLIVFGLWTAPPFRPGKGSPFARRGNSRDLLIGGKAYSRQQSPVSVVSRQIEAVGRRSRRNGQTRPTMVQCSGMDSALTLKHRAVSVFYELSRLRDGWMPSGFCRRGSAQLYHRLSHFQGARHPVRANTRVWLERLVRCDDIARKHRLKKWLGRMGAEIQ
jgi:hypothetical protein